MCSMDLKADNSDHVTQNLERRTSLLQTALRNMTPAATSITSEAPYNCYDTSDSKRWQDTHLQLPAQHTVPAW